MPDRCKTLQFLINVHVYNNRKSLSRLEKVGELNHEAISSKASMMDHESTKSFQRIISCGEALNQQSVKQEQLLENMGNTLKEVELVEEARFSHQLYAERTVAIRGAQTESKLSELTDTAYSLQQIAGRSHSLLQDSRANTDRQAAQMMDLLRSVKSTVENLHDEKASRSQQNETKAGSSSSANHRAEEVTYQIVKV